MKPFEKFEIWSVKHHSPWMDVLRMALGIILTLKGFMFIMDTSYLVTVLNENFGMTNSIVWAHAIAILHLLTGFFITIGLATRISCLVDIPVLIGAIFFVNINSSHANTFELILSVVILALLIFFFVKGSGRFSSYYYLLNSKQSRLTDESRVDYKGRSPIAPVDKDANLL